MFDDGEPLKIQQQRRVRFDDDTLSVTTKHRRSLSADLSATKYDIGMCVWAFSGDQTNLKLNDDDDDDGVVVFL